VFRPLGRQRLHQTFIGGLSAWNSCGRNPGSSPWHQQMLISSSRSNTACRAPGAFFSLFPRVIFNQDTPCRVAQAVGVKWGDSCPLTGWPGWPQFSLLPAAALICLHPASNSMHVPTMPVMCRYVRQDSPLWDELHGGMLTTGRAQETRQAAASVLPPAATIAPAAPVVAPCTWTRLRQNTQAAASATPADQQASPCCCSCCHCLPPPPTVPCCRPSQGCTGDA
jgi:hypothetical protein